MIFDESCSLWEKDSMLNAMTIRNVENAANRKLRTNGHLFLNESIYREIFTAEKAVEMQ